MPAPPSNTRSSAVIVDIDGTVATNVNADGTMLRGHHDYRMVGWDHPKPEIIALVNVLHAAGHLIIFCSGRPQRDGHDFNVHAATKSWLENHVGPWAGQAPLLMRPAGDFRSDDVIKQELFDRYIRDHRNTHLVLDDRDQVVAMWRSLGLTCLQVAPGNF